ncbi:MAG: FAD-dependent thymidylate synthase, partial [Candidatus Paceibacterota bacterium]
MRIIRPYAKISDPFFDFFDSFTDPGIKLLQKCESEGRVSHRSEDKQTYDSYDRFIRSIVLEHGDFSIIEHASITVEAVVDRGITHEWVRHRLGAYTQESTRFVNYEKKIPPSFIYPIPTVICGYCLSGNEVKYQGDGTTFWWCHKIEEKYYSCSHSEAWIRSISMAEECYKELLRKGWRPQESRSVFPNALASKILVTYNLRMWRHFFLMRTSKETHPQFKQVSIPLLKEFQERIPIIYEDIIPESK